MIRPLLSPTRITGNATTGLISAARVGVRNIQRSTNLISRAPDVTKEQRFGMNYVEFFGSKKIGKDLKKSMLTIRDSMSSTFGIVKSLKESVTKGTGVFGFIGNIVRFGALALPFLPFFGVIKTILGLVTVGGIGALLFKFKDDIVKFFQESDVASEIFESIKKNVIGFTSYIKNVIAEFIVSRTMSKEFQTLKKGSELRLGARVRAAEELGLNPQSAIIDETQNEIRILKEERKEFKENENPGLRASSIQKEFYRNQLRAFDARITELQTGRVPVEQPFKTLGLLSGRRRELPFTKGADLIGKFAGNITAEQGIYSTKDVNTLSAAERLDLVKSTLREFENREDISKAKLIYQRELRKGDFLNINQVKQAEDIIKFLDLTTSGDPFENNEKVDKQFVSELKNLSPFEKNIDPVAKNYLKENKRRSKRPIMGGGNGTNLSVLPIGNKSPQPELARNDTGGLSSGPSMRLYSNVDHDNYVALINKSSLNVV